MKNEFKLCFKCHSEIEHFSNPTYYDCFTIRCVKCDYEFDFVNKDQSLKFWNGDNDKRLEKYNSSKNKQSIMILN